MKRSLGDCVFLLKPLLEHRLRTDLPGLLGRHPPPCVIARLPASGAHPRRRRRAHSSRGLDRVRTRRVTKPVHTAGLCGGTGPSPPSEPGSAWRAILPEKSIRNPTLTAFAKTPANDLWQGDTLHGPYLETGLRGKPVRDGNKTASTSSRSTPSYKTPEGTSSSHEAAPSATHAPNITLAFRVFCHAFKKSRGLGQRPFRSNRHVVTRVQQSDRRGLKTRCQCGNPSKITRW